MVYHGRRSGDEEEIGSLIRRLSDREGEDLLELQAGAVELVPGRRRKGARLEPKTGYYDLVVEAEEITYRCSAQGAGTGIMGALLEVDGEEQVYFTRVDDLALENPVHAVYEEGETDTLKVTYGREL
ncbi:MAG: hypothetical protein SVQ76_01005 [Candidatus Nanohaloarchaea archaeon]|nr:hypothetical protein [Candidatus Nanohaloarchaea archaeon]